MCFAVFLPPQAIHFTSLLAKWQKRCSGGFGHSESCSATSVPEDCGVSCAVPCKWACPMRWNVQTKPQS